MWTSTTTATKATSKQFCRNSLYLMAQENRMDMKQDNMQDNNTRRID